MSLDSVELLMSVEKHFDIHISDPEAEKINTVQNFVDSVFDKIILNPSQKCKSQILFYRFRNYFIEKLMIDRNDFTIDQKLNNLIPIDQVEIFWKQMEKDLNIELPSLSSSDIDPTEEREINLLGVTVWNRNAPLTEGTITDMINWTLSINHDKFIDPKNLCNKKDVERAVIGIISESIGVPVNEIKLRHSITNDLGVD